MKRAPAFQMYAKDWISSQPIRLLSTSQRGIYADLLCFCWEGDGLPKSHQEIGKLLNLSRKEIKNDLPKALSLFQISGEKYQESGLIEQRFYQQEKRLKASKSALSRYSSDSKDDNSCDANAQPQQQCESSASRVEVEVAVEVSSKDKAKEDWNRLVGEEFQKLWEDFPKKVDLATAERHFRLAVGNKQDLPRLICICLCVHSFSEEMREVATRNGDNKMVRRLSTFLIEKDYKHQYDDFYPEALAQAEEIMNRPATDLRDEIKNA